MIENSKFTILIAEDHLDIASFIEQGLAEEGYACIKATNGLEALKIAKQSSVSLILLDWMMPEMTGIEVCKTLREDNISTPVIFLTAKDTVEDTVNGLKTGANDYIKKPFNFDELLARIETQLRSHYKIDNVLKIGDIQVNLNKHEVKRGDDFINLTEKEFSFLAYLLKHKDEVCDRQSIIEQVWDIHFDYDTAVLDVFISTIRKKLNLSKNEYIKTIRGIGFMATEHR